MKKVKHEIKKFLKNYYSNDKNIIISKIENILYSNYPESKVVCATITNPDDSNNLNDEYIQINIYLKQKTQNIITSITISYDNKKILKEIRKKKLENLKNGK
jgi:hypothetical protein